MSRDLWHYSRDGEEKMGPTPGEHLRQWNDAGQLPDETLVWREGMEDWIPIQSVAELRGSPPPPSQQAAGAKHDPDAKLLIAMAKRIKENYSLDTLRKAATSKILWFGLVAPFIVLKTLVLPSIISRAVSTVADEGFGIDLSVEDWSASFFDLGATAKNAVIAVPSPHYAKAELMSAEAIEIDLSLWHRITNKRWIREVRIKEPEIYAERLVSGDWNYQKLIDMASLPQVSGSTSESKSLEEEISFSLNDLVVDGMSLEWVENLEIDTQFDEIRDAKATLYIDDITVTATNLVGLVNPSPQRKSRLTIEARTGSGRISFSGRANLFHWRDSWGNTGKVDWMPTVEGTVSLQNVDIITLARLMPAAAITPKRGTMTGSVKFEVIEQEVKCQADLDILNAIFTVNRKSPFVANGASFSDHQASGPYRFSCGGRLGNEHYRPFQAFQTNVIRHGVEDASDNIRALAAVEHSRYSEDRVDSDLVDEIDRILGRAERQWSGWKKLRRYLPGGRR